MSRKSGCDRGIKIYIYLSSLINGLTTNKVMKTSFSSKYGDSFITIGSDDDCEEEPKTELVEGPILLPLDLINIKPMVSRKSLTTKYTSIS